MEGRCFFRFRHKGDLRLDPEYPVKLDGFDTRDASVEHQAMMADAQIEETRKAIGTRPKS